MAHSDSLKPDAMAELTQLTEELGGYDGDTVEDLRVTCDKLREQNTFLLQTIADAEYALVSTHSYSIAIGAALEVLRRAVDE